MTGNPHPGRVFPGWGQALWFSGVSGMESPVPSATITLRPCQSQGHAFSIFLTVRRPACRISSSLSFARALQ
jgi:hypothetical protein